MANRHLLAKMVGPLPFILLGTLARFIPHAPNFTPVAALALFGGTNLDNKSAFLLPISIMVISDLFLGFDSLPMRIFVYGSFLFIVLVGKQLKKNPNLKNTILASFTASVIFFIVTNFAVWAFTPMYLKNIDGLVNCFTMALPFFRNTLLGDLFYTGAIFGSYRIVNTCYHKLSKEVINL